MSFYMRNRENVRYFKLGVTGAAVVAFGLILFFLMFRADGFSGVLGKLSGILRPFIIGAVMAYLVTPLSNWLTRRFGGKHGGLANVLALVIVLVIVLAIVLLIVPKLIDSVVGIVKALPGQAEMLGKRITAALEEDPELQASWQDIYNRLITEADKLLSGLTGDNGKKLADSAAKVLGGAAGSVASVLGVMTDFLIGVIVSLYFLSRRSQLAAQGTLILRGFFKTPWADWIEQEIRFADRMFNGFFLGKLLDSAIVGLICFLGCLAMRFSSPLLIAVIVGVTNIIPFFGPYIGGGVGALLLLFENPTHCLMFLVFVILLQQLDGNVIGPKILGDSTGLSALWVMFGILLFGGLWGIAGMLVGVPLMAIIYDIVRQLTYRGLARHGREEMIASYQTRFHPAAPAKASGGRK